jgi:hypothetical protein
MHSRASLFLVTVIKGEGRRIRRLPILNRERRSNRGRTRVKKHGTVLHRTAEVVCAQSSARSYPQRVQKQAFGFLLVWHCPTTCNVVLAKVPVETFTRDY